MKSSPLRTFLFLVVTTLLFSACSSDQKTPTGTGDGTVIPPVKTDFNIVVEGRIVPREWVELSFFTSGQIQEILVNEGDTVKKGDVLVRLGNREATQAAIASAEAEVLAAQQAFDRLFKDIDITRAAAMEAVADAYRAVRDAQYQLDNFTIPVGQEGLTALEGVLKMKKVLDQARDAFEPYKYKSSGDKTRQELKKVLDQAQSDYNSAVRRLDYETTLKQAQAILDQTLKNYQDLENGPSLEDISTSKARVTAARATLDSAKATLKNLELVSTIDGMVVHLDLIIGEQVSAGQPVIKIADFTQMYVETDDLTEIEVVDVRVGQKVIVIPDALPDLEITGMVEKISNVFEEKRGDITYTARILLDSINPRLLWGMTVVITFQK